MCVRVPCVREDKERDLRGLLGSGGRGERECEAVVQTQTPEEEMRVRRGGQQVRSIE